MDSVSYSRLFSAINCKHKYFVRYHLKPESKHLPESSYFTVGKIVHNVIEDYYGGNKDVDAALDAHWREVTNDELVEKFQEYHRVYSEALEATIRFGFESYGKAYKNPCATTHWKQTYEIYFEDRKKQEFQELLRDPRLSHIKFHRHPIDLYLDSRRCVDNFALMDADAAPKVKKVHTEIAIDPAVRVGEHSLTGRIDRIEELKDGSIHVFDYKTRKFYWKPEEVLNDNQLGIYALATEAIFGRIPNKVGIWDIFNKNVIEVDFTPRLANLIRSKLERNLGHLESIEEQIKAGNADALPIPAGFGMKFGCPCDLVFADPAAEINGTPIKCPYYESNGKTQLEDELSGGY